MKKIKIGMIALLMVFGLTVQQAAATQTNIEFNTHSVDGTLAVQTFDWNASGSGAVYTAPGVQYVPGSPLAVGQVITFLYQANLSAFDAPGGAPIGGLTGLNSAYELTIVATLVERVSTFVSVPGVTTATFQSIGGTGAIYYGPVNSNVGAGTGFADGTLIAQGTIVPGTNSAFTLFSTGTPPGTGATNINAILDPLFLNTSFFLTPGGLPFTNLHDIDFTGQLNFPPENSATVCFFCGSANPNFTATSATAANDLKVDGSNTFTVPEPSSMLLLGSSLIGLAAFLRRKSTKANREL